jgi:hypothetical protein
MAAFRRDLFALESGRSIQDPVGPDKATGTGGIARQNPGAITQLSSSGRRAIVPATVSLRWWAADAEDER